jgi:hypothetical protein
VFMIGSPKNRHIDRQAITQDQFTTEWAVLPWRNPS